ncbi:HP1 family phage holin [Dickeya dianthicola]|uniref:HP1 family phage holin n=1 Tax=Dickeya dianthicola TaxID=204039 RepID=UPI001F601B82|nr:HP1 family phage holin [Dickeya dianthicola]MCI4217771.1 HP1 family phage holin [Dickeya dianthicola]
MGLNDLQRLNDGVTYGLSVMVTGIGVMTVSEKVALAGLVIGVVTAWRAWLFRRRIERAQRRRNELIEQILQQSERRTLNTSERRAVAILHQGDIDDENRD